MRVLFDHGTPDPLRRHLTNHVVETSAERGWSQLQNGELLDIAEQEKFDVLVTTDQKLKYQQNLTGRSIAIVVLLSTSWPKIQLRIQDVRQAIDDVKPGSYIEIPI